MEFNVWEEIAEDPPMMNFVILMSLMAAMSVFDLIPTEKSIT